MWYISQIFSSILNNSYFIPKISIIFIPKFPFRNAVVRSFKNQQATRSRYQVDRLREYSFVQAPPFKTTK